MKSKLKVNSSYQYRDDVICLLWQNHLQQRGCKYFLKENEQTKTLFGKSVIDSTRQQKPAGLVLNSNGSLYKCLYNGRTLSIAQAIDRDPVSSGVESSTASLDEAFDQCKIWQNSASENPKKYDFLEYHTIIMPYHNGFNHWNLACLEIDWEKDKIKKMHLKLYEPLISKREVSEKEKLKTLKNKIATNLGINKKLIQVTQIKTLQQTDSAACGPITAENGVHYITSNEQEFKKHLNTVYNKDAIHGLREHHLKKINNTKFTKEQHYNYFYYNSSCNLELQDLYDPIVNTIEKCLNENQNLRLDFKNTVEQFIQMYQVGQYEHKIYESSTTIQSNISTFFNVNYDVLKKYSIPNKPEKNLANLFFEKNVDGLLRWKDSILDDVWEIFNKWYNTDSIKSNEIEQKKTPLNFETYDCQYTKEISKDLFEHVDHIKSEVLKEELVKIFKNPNSFFNNDNKPIVDIKYYSQQLQNDNDQQESDIALDSEVAIRMQFLINKK